MAKRRFKYYSIEQKVEYHKKRLNSPRATDNQRCCSRFWLDGFNDRNYRNNLSATRKELERRKSFKSKDNRDYCNNVLNPSINGMKARQELCNKVK